MIGIALLTSVLGRAALVQTQTVDAQCEPSYNYLDNTLGQSPCVVTAYLSQLCAPEGKNWYLPALGPRQSYIGPDLPNASYCDCSSVVYALTSACARCQDRFAIPWSNWAFNCSDSITTLMTYPLDIPPGTAVPAWAYQNVSINDRFDLGVAQSSTGAQSTYPGIQTASINYHDVDQARQTSAPVNSSSSKSHVGPIVGGVIGGVAVSALLGVLIVSNIRKKTYNVVQEGSILSTAPRLEKSLEPPLLEPPLLELPLPIPCPQPQYP